MAWSADPLHPRDCEILRCHLLGGELMILLMRIQWMIIATLTSLLMWGGVYDVALGFLRSGHHDLTIAHIERRLERRFL